jgi:methionyl aminopeptidase
VRFRLGFLRPRCYKASLSRATSGRSFRRNGAYIESVPGLRIWADGVRFFWGGRMSIEQPNEWGLLFEVGRVVRRTLQEMASRVRPGVTTAELDAIAGRVFREEGARSAPRAVYNFPGETCISVNDEIVHGIPSERVIRPGDLVKLDVVAEKDGYMADAAVTVPVPPVSDAARMLVRCAMRAFDAAARAAQLGNRVNDIGRAVEREVRRCRFSVVRSLAGHGVGRSIHEEPCVPNYYDRRADQPLTEGLVLAVEPMIAQHSGESVQDGDGWTVRTADGGLAAHYEHTLVITSSGPVLVTGDGAGSASLGGNR